MSRLRDRYQKEIMPALRKEYGYGNVMAVPKLEKIVVNIGLGEAIQNPKLLDSAMDELGAITGQRPVINRARKSIASFKLRQGMAIACSVTLRSGRMYEFFDRLINALEGAEEPVGAKSQLQREAHRFTPMTGSVGAHPMRPRYVPK